MKMERKFRISCESTVDLPYSYMESRDIPVLFYSYTIEGKEYEDDMGRNKTAPAAFYERIEAGQIPKTSQLNTFAYCEFFEKMLEGGDCLHIVFGSGMTTSINNAIEAAEIVRKKYPENKLVVVDSTCSSSGYGLLVDAAADLRDEGKSMEDVEKWLIANRTHVHHQFYSTDLKYYRRSGRISGAAAAVGAVLNLCPLMRLNRAGKIVAYSKVRGKKAAVKETVSEMLAHADGGEEYSGKCFICHSNCISDAEKTRDAIEKAFPNLCGKIRICDIGMIIASHCGPDTVAAFFMGDERPEC